MVRVLVILLLLAPSAFAQTDEAFEGEQVHWPEFEDAPADAPTARIGFVFDEVSRRREAAIVVGEPVEVLLVAWDVQVALHAWEAGIDIDERLKVIETEYFADLHMENDGDVRAMLKPENCKASAAITLARYKLLLTEPANDLVLGIRAAAIPTAVTSEADVSAPTPVYQVCREDKDMRPFLFSPVSAVLNPVQVHPDPIEGDEPSFRPEPSRQRH